VGRTTLVPRQRTGLLNRAAHPFGFRLSKVRFLTLSFLLITRGCDFRTFAQADGLRPLLGPSAVEQPPSPIGPRSLRRELYSHSLFKRVPRTCCRGLTRWTFAGFTVWTRTLLTLSM